METNNSWIDFFIFFFTYFVTFIRKICKKDTKGFHTYTVDAYFLANWWDERNLEERCSTIWVAAGHSHFVNLSQKRAFMSLAGCVCVCVCLCVCVFLSLLVSCLCVCGVFTRDLCLVVVHLNSLAKEQMSAANPQNGDNKDHHHYQLLHQHTSQHQIAHNMNNRRILKKTHHTQWYCPLWPSY